MVNSHPHRLGGRARGLFIAPICLALLGALSAGCTRDEERPPQTPPSRAADVPAAPAAAVDQAPSREDRNSPTSGSVHIDDRITKACGDIPTAHFAFDSARVSPDAGIALETLARCFVSGPLKGRSLRLVGHADPRGETEYNVALGQRRAGGVGAVLTGHGLDKAKIQTLSKGAFEATGTDEEGWARDRKVDVFLVEERP